MHNLLIEFQSINEDELSHYEELMSIETKLIHEFRAKRIQFIEYHERIFTYTW
jgi:hypothetical protein